MLKKTDEAHLAEGAQYRDWFRPSRWLIPITVAAATTILSLSALFWVKRNGLNPLMSHSEFFAYSWMYGIRWGAGEDVFLPHSQLLFPIFALIDRAFNLTSGSPRHIIEGWSQVSFYWPVFVMLAALSAVFMTIDRRRPLLDTIFSSFIFIVSFPLFLEDAALFSTSYHSLSIPLALAGLMFWKEYLDDPARSFRIRFFVVLGAYAALCALGKPTFVVFAIPFFAMETIKAIQARTLRSFAKVALAVSVAAFTYLAAIIAFYHHGITGVTEHFAWSKIYVISQYHWYDAAKGATPIHWYFGYVIGVMGWLPTLLILASLVLASLSEHRRILLTGVISGYACALFCLYSRSQLHGHPEFIAAAAAIVIGAFRCSIVPGIIQRWLDARYLGAAFHVVIGISTACIFSLVYPLDLRGHDFMVQLAKYEAPITDTLFQERKDVRTVAMMIYPNILNGSADAWCRGGSNIFNSIRSDFVDSIFENAVCADRGQSPNRDYAKFNNALFVRNRTSSLDETISVLRAAFPLIVNRFNNCHEIDGVLPDHSSLIECGLNPSD